MRQGRFIAFEGPEGCGKSTHLPLLADFLRERGIEVVTTREPGGTALAERIREMLQTIHAEPPVPAAEVLLFLASRAQHVEKVIRPALARGAWVLTDRFEDSTFAYQGAGRGFDQETLRRLNRFATAGCSPDLVLLLDIPRDAGRVRLRARQAATVTEADRFEREAESFQENLRKGFLALAHDAPERYEIIRTDQPRETVAQMIRSAVTAHFQEVSDAAG